MSKIMGTRFLQYIGRMRFGGIIRPMMCDVRSLLTRTDKDGIRRITLDNPKKRNALSLEMLESIKKNLTEENAKVKVIILSANGPVFSAGHDLKELKEHDSSYQKRVFDCCADVMNLLQEIPAPVIAKVNGLATAAGCQMVASCDLAVVSDTSTFSTPGALVGLFCSTPGIAVARSVPSKVALHMLLTGFPITAQDALQYGLVSKVVTADKLDEENGKGELFQHQQTYGHSSDKIAERICELSQPVIAMGKKFYYRQIKLDRRQAYSEGTGVMVDNLSLPDGREGLESFINKRKPVWSNQ